ARSWLELLENMDLGVIAFASEKKQIVFQNRTMRGLMPDGSLDEYAQLEKIFLSDPEVLSAAKPSQQKLLLADKTIGFTVYPRVNGLQWILAS
ncbi:MAG TPA: hypothetical protein VLQ89_09665, partial [Candidatus Binatia bacterium]|nr:hypothetical protein [Candidatus Binatia bacterium]